VNETDLCLSQSERMAELFDEELVFFVLPLGAVELE